MKRPKCACVHPDAMACLEWRSPGANFDPEDHRVKTFERCDCHCHEEDDDGRSGWDEEPRIRHAPGDPEIEVAGGFPMPDFLIDPDKT